MDYEAFIAGGDPAFPVRLPDDEWQAIALNYTSGTTGNPKGVVLHHRGAYLNAVRQCADIRAVAAQRLSVDAADVPLQRLDLYLGGDAGGRHACLPAPRRSGADLRGDRRAWRDAYVRRAGGAEHADPCAGDARRAFPQTVQIATGGAAPPSRGDRADGGDGLCGDASLWADGKLRAVDGVHVAAGAGRHADGAEVGVHGAAGREHADAGRCGGARSRDDDAACRRTARRWAN